jgi:hypothetical protein
MVEGWGHERDVFVIEVIFILFETDATTKDDLRSINLGDNTEVF